MRDVFCCHCGPCLGGCPSVSEITILLPGVQIRELEIIVRFLYTGKSLISERKISCTSPLPKRAGKRTSLMAEE